MMYGFVYDLGLSEWECGVFGYGYGRAQLSGVDQMHLYRLLYSIRSMALVGIIFLVLDVRCVFVWEHGFPRV
jgi:hypothetical protein